MTGESVRLVEVTTWLSSCSVSRWRQKSLSNWNVWVREVSVFMSEFAFGEARCKKAEEREERKGTWEEGNLPMPETYYSEDWISLVSRLS